MPSPRTDHRYSLVIPVYNSAGIVGTTVDRVVEVFTEAGLDHEVILVNDGSRDGSWEVIAAKAAEHPQVIALDLLRNYGQHYANMAGLREASGDFLITLDDDMQNPPEEALKLIDAALEHGHDVVFGKFERKQAAGYRRIGSWVIGELNKRIFKQPEDLVVSNFRILRRDVVDRILGARAAHPYLTGQALMFSRDPAHVLVRHQPRTVGKSTYNITKILRLAFTILFSYSSFPLRLAAGAGFMVAGVSFLLGALYLILGLAGRTQVQGWTTLVVLVSVLGGFIIALLSMVGEYVVRTLQTVSIVEDFHVIRKVGR